MELVSGQKKIMPLKVIHTMKPTFMKMAYSYVLMVTKVKFGI